LHTYLKKQDEFLNWNLLFTFANKHSSKTKLDRSCQQHGKKKDPQTNSTICTLGQNYRASSKKMAQDCNRPHGLTHVWRRRRRKKKKMMMMMMMMTTTLVIIHKFK
jgi:hypothetical protein